MDIDWAQADIEVGGKTLHYHRTGGKGKPPIVLTHGFTDNGLCWLQAAKALEPAWDVIMPDLRGHGLSARVKPGEDVDMPADLAGLIRALRLDKPVLCGHSMGAMTSFMATVRYPELVRALVLEDPPWFMEPWPKASPESGSNPIVEWARTLPSQSLESLLQGYRKDHPDWPDDLLVAMCESKKQLDPAIGEIMTEKMNPEEGHWTGLIASLRCPTLVLSADPMLGGIVSPAIEAKIAELNPRVRIVNIKGAGHLIRFDAFPAFMEAVNAFLTGL